jgi:hypothetical protein
LPKGFSTPKRRKAAKTRTSGVLIALNDGTPEAFAAGATLESMRARLSELAFCLISKMNLLKIKMD